MRNPFSEKYVGSVFVIFAFPRSLGNGPTMFRRPPLTYVSLPVMFSGPPELRLAIQLSCHRSTILASHPELFESSSLLGPIGSSNVPFVRKSCVRWEGCSCRSSDRSTGFRKPVVAVERPLLQT